MRLEWKYSARADRKRIHAYVAQHNPIATVTLTRSLSEKALWLLQHPHLGYPGRLAGTREWVVHPHYILVYELTPDTVHILRVLHTAQRWP